MKLVHIFQTTPNSHIENFIIYFDEIQFLFCRVKLIRIQKIPAQELSSDWAARATSFVIHSHIGSRTKLTDFQENKSVLFRFFIKCKMNSFFRV